MTKLVEKLERLESKGIEEEELRQEKMAIWEARRTTSQEEQQKRLLAGTKWQGRRRMPVERGAGWQS